MAGTRTAPDVTGTVDYKIVTVYYMDYKGRRKADSVQCDPAVTQIQIEAYVDAAQALSNGTIWRVDVSEAWVGAKLVSNAQEAVFVSVEDGMVTQLKSALNASQNTFVPALVETAMVEGTYNIDHTAGTVTAYLTAVNAMMPSGTVAVGVRFSEHTKINKQQAV